MAIKSVTNANLAQYVAERTAKGSEIQTGEQVTAEVQRTAEAKSPVVAAVAETTPDAPPDPGVQTPSAKEPKKEGKGSFQERINELTREKKELDEFAQSEYEARLASQRRIEELETQLKQLTPAPKAAEVEAEPDPAKFTDQKEFLSAWGDWNRRQALAMFKAEEAARQAKEHAQKQDELLKARAEKAMAEIPDFADVIERGSKRNGNAVPNHIKAAIMESDYGPQIAYELAKDEALEKRIYGLSPAKALLELGKIESTYEAREPAASQAAPAKTPTVTKAPPPMTQLKPSDAVIPQDLSQPMNFKDYKRKRIEENRRARG
jgi:hypothetical protein